MLHREREREREGCCRAASRFFLKWAVPGLFFFNFVYSTPLTVNKCSIKVLPMTGFEPWIRPLYQVSHNHCPLQVDFENYFSRFLFKALFERFQFGYAEKGETYNNSCKLDSKSWLVVMSGALCSGERKFESQHSIVNISNSFVVKNRIDA